MKLFIYILLMLFICISNGLYSQYYTPAQLSTIKATRSAFEGDLYLDTNGRNFYIGLTTGELARIGDTLDETIDTTFLRNDSILIVESGDTAYINIFPIRDHDWYKIGTTDEPNNISDSIFTGGDLQITNYPETRADDTSSYLNTLYTDGSGNIKSGRREIIPPSPFIDISTASVGNTFNYYTYYSTQFATAGLTPIPLANLDFYVLAYDPAIFANVSISALGVLSFEVLSNTATTSCIDVRFYTK